MVNYNNKKLLRPFEIKSYNNNLKSNIIKSVFDYNNLSKTSKNKCNLSNKNSCVSTRNNKRNYASLNIFKDISTDKKYTSNEKFSKKIYKCNALNETHKRVIGGEYPINKFKEVSLYINLVCI